MFTKKIFAIAILATSILATSCLKNDTTPTTTTPTYTDPSLEISAIDHFTDSMGFDNMQYASLTGFKYETVELGDTSVAGKITNELPVGTFKYKVTLLNGTGVDSSYNLTNGTVTVNFVSQSVSTIPSIMLTDIWSYVFFNTSVPRKIGKGGHLRFVTPSAYTYVYYANAYYSTKPLFVDVYLTNVSAL
ncbi:MAG: hypothetical protein DI598_12160 [Pseudopedobacter saltans]|uniref:Uncharacterized protein n=1 Tax=Pseudopedobacter saltans TaxID=151895 RepID=A0A2W5EWT6_9SPHI|nr:MAG: hypothetical protein DI598_12160 [Pseudopedobacter saltans]